MKLGGLMKKILLVLAIAGVMISCSATTKVEGDKEATTKTEVIDQTLLGTTWKLEKYSIDGNLVDVIENSEADLIFQEDRFAGNGSVNRYFGSYKLEGKDLKMGPVGRTLMMGPEDASDQEFTYTQLLEKVTSWEIVGDKLTLLEDGKVVLVFKAIL
jgi:heat shock protein HslJ